MASLFEWLGGLGLWLVGMQGTEQQKRPAQSATQGATPTTDSAAASTTASAAAHDLAASSTQLQQTSSQLLGGIGSISQHGTGRPQSRSATDEPPRGTDQPPLPTVQSSSPTDHSQFSADQPPSLTDEPPHPTDQPPHPTDQPPHPTDQPPHLTDQPPHPTDQPLHHTDQWPSHTDQLPPCHTGQLPSHTDQLAHAADKPPSHTGQSSSDAGHDNSTGNAMQLGAANDMHATARGDGEGVQPVEDTCTQPIIHPAPHDLASLAALLAGPSTGTPPVVDLQGRTLAGQCDDDITVSHPGLKLMNGTLHLPGEVSLLLTGDGIHLQDVTITQSVDATTSYSVYIEAKGVKLELCRVPEVYVQPNSSASLLWCILSGSGGDGVYVEGPDSIVHVRDSDAHHNQGAGFAASGAGAVMRLEGRCRARNNINSGFCAENGARMICSDGCMATGNESGFLATGMGTQMIIGHGCRAQANKGPGFQAEFGAKLAVGDRCEAYGNIQAGFGGMEPDTKLCLGRGCRAVRNGDSGVWVQAGAKGTTGQGCIAASNALNGFVALDKGSILRVGARSKAAYNRHADLNAVEGGQVHAGAGCEVAYVYGAPPIVVSGRLEDGRWHK